MIPNDYFDAFIFHSCFRPSGVLCLDSSEPGSVSENVKLEFDTNGHGICGASLYVVAVSFCY